MSDVEDLEEAQDALNRVRAYRLATVEEMRERGVEIPFPARRTPRQRFNRRMYWMRERLAHWIAPWMD